MQIERGIPLPSNARKSAGQKYPLEGLEVGDSFLIPGDRKPTAVRSSLWARCKVLGITVHAAEVIGQGGERGVRVWRKS